MPATAALPTTSLYAARPEVHVDGADAPTVADATVELHVQEDTQGMRRCELRLGNVGATPRGIGPTVSRRDVVDLGSSLRIAIGSGARAGEVFDGTVTALEEHWPSGAAPEVVLLAEDRLQALRMTRRTRTFVDTSDADAIDAVARAHGLRTDIDVEGPTHEVLAQVDQSDLAFVRERAAAVDGVVRLDGATLVVHRRGRHEQPRLTLTHGADLHSFRVLADLAHQRTGVAVAGWDVAGKDVVAHHADASAVAAEVGAGTSGPDVLAATLGDRVERIVAEAPWTDAEARALAEASLRRRARRFLTGHGVAEGDARLVVGTRVELAGLSSISQGEYVVVETGHRYDATAGYRTSFRVERPWIGDRP